jgi:16S rRNA (cytosine967-C5)-methyltransferase
VVEVLDPLPGERVLDLCAGPGIKTGQIAARVGRTGNMVSVEPVESRAEDVATQRERLGFHHGLVVEADARDSEILRGFDRVLLDAPCSDLGALASRPDARWRKSPATIERLVEVQAELLQRGLEALRPGGTLVYSTCTISRRENEGRVNVEDSIQLRPDRDRTTGFFIGRTKRDDGEG